MTIKKRGKAAKNKILTGIFAAFLAGGIARGNAQSPIKKEIEQFSLETIVNTPLNESLFNHKYETDLDLKERKNLSTRDNLITNQRLNWIELPLEFYLQSDINFQFHFNSETYVKGTLNMKHYIENPNVITALGYSGGTRINFEFFFNSENSTLGIAFSNKSLFGERKKYLGVAQKVINSLSQPSH
jgi:hypothetical protein